MAVLVANPADGAEATGCEVPRREAGESRTPALEQQPMWPDRASAASVRTFLATLPALTSPPHVRAVASLLREVQAGRAFAFQGGDCAEPFGAAAVASARRKHQVMATMVAHLHDALAVPVVRIGRIAGQFAKPRSLPTEVIDGTTLPSFRGLIINGPAWLESDRRPDPHRMLTAYHTAQLVLDELARLGAGHDEAAAMPTTAAGPRAGRMFVSHEALLLDYEEPFVRLDSSTGDRYLLSTDLPWIGDRTRRVDGAHVDFLSSVSNPVACKIGPSATVDDVLGLCHALDAGRAPGRLTLISRIGAGLIRRRLPALVRAVQHAGYPVIWMCDPMHGNQLRTASGLKTRRVVDIVEEVHGFLSVMDDCNQWPGGLHLELAGEDVTECLWDGDATGGGQLHRAYRSLCDGRLNNAQAGHVVEQFASPMRRRRDNRTAEVMAARG